MSSRLMTTLLASAMMAAAQVPATAFADVVTDWNEIALNATIDAGLPPPVQSRAMALVHAAIFDAVNGILRTHKPYLVTATAAAGALPEAAAAGAAHEMLTKLFPSARPQLDAALAKSLGVLSDGEQKANGLSFGHDVADRLFELRRQDGFDAKVRYAGRSGPGAWQPTPPAKADPVLPQWGAVKPFMLTGSTQIALPAPPRLEEAAFARDVEEVTRLGSWNSAARTSEQTAIAIYWSGSEITPWNAVARAAALAHHDSVADNARLFALLNMTMADTLIAGFAYKYQYDHWRPVTAIQASASGDKTWRPLLVTPPHPEYPSAHCLASGAAAVVLRTFFGSDDVAVSQVYPPLGVLRTWANYTQIVKEVEDARVWGGIHFRSADEQGTLLGQSIAAYSMANFLQPLPAKAP